MSSVGVFHRYSCIFHGYSGISVVYSGISVSRVTIALFPKYNWVLSRVTVALFSKYNWVFPCPTENPVYPLVTVRACNMGLNKAPYEKLPDSVAQSGPATQVSGLVIFGLPVRSTGRAIVVTLVVCMRVCAPITLC